MSTAYSKTKDAFPKIKAWAYNRYSRLIPRQLTATKTSHENLIHIFSVSIEIIPTRSLQLFWSWISITQIQFHKEKENFVIACLRPSQNVKLGIFTW